MAEAQHGATPNDADAQGQPPTNTEIQCEICPQGHCYTTTCTGSRPPTRRPIYIQFQPSQNRIQTSPSKSKPRGISAKATSIQSVKYTDAISRSPQNCFSDPIYTLERRFEPTVPTFLYDAHHHGPEKRGASTGKRTSLPHANAMPNSQRARRRKLQNGQREKQS
jgi:hypothetical protein